MNVVTTMSPFVLVELSQTIPEDGALVCPGQVLQYTCSSNESLLIWDINSSIQNFFDSTNSVNSSFNLGEFVAKLTAKDGSFLSSTLTNTMIALSKNGQQIQCFGIMSVDHINITIAGNHLQLNFMAMK